MQPIKLSSETYCNPGHMTECGQILVQQSEHFGPFKKLCMNAAGNVDFNLVWRFRASAIVPFSVYVIRLKQDVKKSELLNIVFRGGKSSYTPWHCIPNATLGNTTSARGQNNNKKGDCTQEDFSEFTLIWAKEATAQGKTDFVLSGVFVARSLPRSTFCREIADSSDENYLEGDILRIVCPRVKWAYTVPNEEPAAEKTTLDNVQVGDAVENTQRPCALLRNMYPDEERVYITSSLELFAEEVSHHSKSSKSGVKRNSAGAKRKRATRGEQAAQNGNGGMPLANNQTFEDYFNALADEKPVTTKSSRALKQQEDVDDDDDLAGIGEDTMGMVDDDK